MFKSSGQNMLRNQNEFRTILLRYGPVVVLTLFVLIGFTAWVTVQHSWYDYDTYWHLRVGLDMLDKKQIEYEAINTFQNHLPFIPHEAGFQIILAVLYKLGGWRAVHLIAVTSIGFLLWGLYQLAVLSRKEIGLNDFHPLLHMAVAVIVFVIYLAFYKIRPQIVSTPAILWFFIWMRRYQMRPTKHAALMMFVLALFVSNVHAGVYPILLVFWIFCLIESLFSRTVHRGHVIITACLIAAALCNPDPLHSVFYIQGTKGFAKYITEWMPVDFRQYPVFALGFLLYIWGMWASGKKSLFRLVFGIGVLFLGVACYKTHLFLWLFLIYELASALESIPYVGAVRCPILDGRRYIVALYLLAVGIFLIRGILTPYSDNKQAFPSEEMDFIAADGNPFPKVLAPYAVSGYVMYRDARVLCDGRYDPFVQPLTKSIRDRTAFERSLSAFQSSDDLLETLRSDQPDYLILPNQNPTSAARERILKELGPPVFKGDYGIVFKIREE